MHGICQSGLRGVMLKVALFCNYVQRKKPTRNAIALVLAGDGYPNG
jgi:hypothetical protein